MRDPDSLAKVISVSRGQSGDNRDYLYLLEKSLEEFGLGYVDAHVVDLVRRVKALEGTKEQQDGGVDTAVPPKIRPGGELEESATSG